MCIGVGVLVVLSDSFELFIAERAIKCFERV